MSLDTWMWLIFGALVVALLVLLGLWYVGEFAAKHSDAELQKAQDKHDESTLAVRKTILSVVSHLWVNIDKLPIDLNSALMMGAIHVLLERGLAGTTFIYGEMENTKISVYRPDTGFITAAMFEESKTAGTRRAIILSKDRCLAVHATGGIVVGDGRSFVLTADQLQVINSYLDAALLDNQVHMAEVADTMFIEAVHGAPLSMEIN